MLNSSKNDKYEVRVKLKIWITQFSNTYSATDFKHIDGCEYDIDNAENYGPYKRPDNTYWNNSLKR